MSAGTLARLTEAAKTRYACVLAYFLRHLGATSWSAASKFAISTSLLLRRKGGGATRAILLLER
jgi:hypothetical protein